MDSINRTDLDLRKSLFSNIVLSGGSTLCTGLSIDQLILSFSRKADIAYSTGFGDRLLNEVKKLALKDVKLKIYAPPERKVISHHEIPRYTSPADKTRKYSTWIGGSILAGLSTFKKVSCPGHSRCVLGVRRQSHGADGVGT